MAKQVYPSIINANLLNIQSQLTLLDRHCPGYHIDVMDGYFVPNSTFGVAMVNAIARESTTTHQWVHLMVINPEFYIATMQLLPGSLVTFHFETNIEIKKTSALIKEKKWKASIAISPKTAPEKLFPYLHDFDQVLVMSVEPGFSGQPFLTESVEKVALLNAYRQTAGLQFRIGIDGGVSLANCVQLAQVGVDDFAVASAIFESQDPVDAITRMTALVNQ